MNDPLSDLQAVMALIDETPMPEPIECHTTPAGFRAMRALLTNDSWTEQHADVSGLDLSFGVVVYQDPEMTGEWVEFRRPDGTVVGRLNLAR